MSDVAGTLKDATTKMDKALEVAKEDFASIRTGRAHPSLFNKVMVDYYGTFTPLSQLASIQVPEFLLLIREQWRLLKKLFVNQILELIQETMAL
ncbi:MAG: ribosome recycling factor [Actinobacteria bacterium]|nr:ribosome recycling factor [Actinomycetota bacterium]